MFRANTHDRKRLKRPPERMLCVTALCFACTLGFNDHAAAGRPRSAGKPWVGVMMGTDKLAGVPVLQVFGNSPAQKAGIKKGDRILAVGHKPVHSHGQVVSAIKAHKIGKTVSFTLDRNNRRLKLNVKLAPRPTMENLVKGLLVGKTAPPLTVTLPGNTPRLKLKQLRNNVVLIKFWSLSCPACITSIAKLRRWHKKYARSGLVILAVAKNSNRRLQQAVNRFGIPYMVGQISAKTSRRYLVPLIPMFVLVGPKGKIRDVAVGFGKSMSRIKRKVIGLLQKQNKGSATRPSRSAPIDTPTSPLFDHNP